MGRIDNTMKATDPNYKQQIVRNELGQFSHGTTPGPMSGNRELIRQGHARQRQLWQEVTPTVLSEVIRRHLSIIRSATPAVALKAIELLYDRLWGKPMQSVALDATATTRPAFDPRNLSDADLDTVLGILAPMTQTPMLDVHGVDLGPSPSALPEPSETPPADQPEP